MLENITIYKEFEEIRSINSIIFKLTPRDTYIMNQYTKKLSIENRTTWLVNLIEADIQEKIDAGFVEIK